jgi:hypothetical protein
MGLAVTPPSRGELLTALRLWRGSGHGDSLTLEEMSGLLGNEASFAMSQKAIDQISAAVTRKFGGDTISCEQLVQVLIPASRVSDFQDLSPTEVETMQQQFDAVAKAVVGNPLTTLPALPEPLAQVASHVAGFTPGEARETRVADAKAVASALQIEGKTYVDLATAFAAFREQQKRSKPPPNEQQLLRLFDAFDCDANGTLTTTKAKAIAKAYGADDELSDAIREANVSIEERHSMRGGWQPRAERGSSAKEEKYKPPTMVNIAKMVSAHVNRGVKIVKD